MLPSSTAGASLRGDEEADSLVFDTLLRSFNVRAGRRAPGVISRLAQRMDLERMNESSHSMVHMQVVDWGLF